MEILRHGYVGEGYNLLVCEETEKGMTHNFHLIIEVVETINSKK
jgi:hypothetical protein